MDAIILGGGVAKGAFGAGALAELGKAGLRVRRLVGTSSGAINAAFYARAVRSGAEREGGEELARIWIEEATLTDGFNVSLRGIAGAEGISTSAKLVSLLRRHIPPSTGRHPVDLRLVTTSLRGERGSLAPGKPGTTFEHVLRYGEAALDTSASLEGVFHGVAASAAFPGAFVPVPVEIDGEAVSCVDGGATNNTPVKYAIEAAGEVDRIFVVAPYPALVEGASGPRGLSLLSQLVDALIEERLYRDLREANSVNAALERLEELLQPAVLAGVLRALEWSNRRRLELVELRPFAELSGGPFDGFVSRRLREQYVHAGRAAARAWLDRRTGQTAEFFE
jgi:NTE family protein